tara:strand:- start:316 stop:519 length:204 start_codon:yes stop_codon:yes gene_type:complete
MSKMSVERPTNKDKAIKALQEDEPEMRKLSINISKALHKEVKRYALDHDMTVTEFVLEMIKKHMKNN